MRPVATAVGEARGLTAAHAQVEAALAQGFRTVSIDTWLSVIPQLIARIDNQSAPVRRLVHELLCRIGQAHPQVG